ncbi:hypothetical protein HK100_005362 [Physocladia obscura]|uniref:polynucleotide adenylyltransferase n=1 Tax=Physocladia obscura TaxID=109957 RepID=A0AAD5T6K7_9FUNG|nr:hypothetical protein HK100_005362 [Physocladia obscura]
MQPIVGIESQTMREREVIGGLNDETCSKRQADGNSCSGCDSDSGAGADVDVDLEATMTTTAVTATTASKSSGFGDSVEYLVSSGVSERASAGSGAGKKETEVFAVGVALGTAQEQRISTAAQPQATAAAAALTQSPPLELRVRSATLSQSQLQSLASTLVATAVGSSCSDSRQQQPPSMNTPTTATAIATTITTATTVATATGTGPMIASVMPRRALSYSAVVASSLVAAPTQPQLSPPLLPVQQRLPQLPQSQSLEPQQQLLSAPIELPHVHLSAGPPVTAPNTAPIAALSRKEISKYSQDVPLSGNHFRSISVPYSFTIATSQATFNNQNSNNEHHDQVTVFDNSDALSLDGDGVSSNHRSRQKSGPADYSAPNDHRKYNKDLRDVSLKFKPTGQMRFKEDIASSGDYEAVTGIISFDTIDLSTAVTYPMSLPSENERKLTDEINLLGKRLLPTEYDITRRQEFVQKIQNLVDQEWPDKEIKVHAFGSTVNGLGSLTSDVDLCLTTPWKDPQRGISNMFNLATFFRKHGMTKIYTVSKAKVPICKFYDPEFDLACDTNVNNILALRNTALLKAYVDLDPRAINFLQTRSPPILPSLQKIYMDKLAFARQAATTVLPNAQPTPPLQTTIIEGVDCSFEQNTAELKPQCALNTSTLGALFYSFFRSYACEFSFPTQVVSVRHGTLLSKHSKAWDIDVERMYRHFCVEEPLTPDRNLANSADAIAVAGLRAEFRRGLECLLKGGGVEAACEPYYVNLSHQYFSQRNFQHSNSYQKHQSGSSGGGYGDSRGKSSGGKYYGSKYKPDLQNSNWNGGEKLSNGNSSSNSGGRDGIGSNGSAWPNGAVMTVYPAFFTPTMYPQASQQSSPSQQQQQQQQQQKQQQHFVEFSHGYVSIPTSPTNTFFVVQQSPTLPQYSAVQEESTNNGDTNRSQTVEAETKTENFENLIHDDDRTMVSPNTVFESGVQSDQVFPFSSANDDKVNHSERSLSSTASPSQGNSEDSDTSIPPEIELVDINFGLGSSSGNKNLVHSNMEPPVMTNSDASGILPGLSHGPLPMNYTSPNWGGPFRQWSPSMPNTYFSMIPIPQTPNNTGGMYFDSSTESVGKQSEILNGGPDGTHPSHPQAQNLWDGSLPEYIKNIPQHFNQVQIPVFWSFHQPLPNGWPIEQPMVSPPPPPYMGGVDLRRTSSMTNGEFQGMHLNQSNGSLHPQNSPQQTTQDRRPSIVGLNTKSYSADRWNQNIKMNGLSFHNHNSTGQSNSGVRGKNRLNQSTVGAVMTTLIEQNGQISNINREGGSGEYFGAPTNAAAATIAAHTGVGGDAMSQSESRYRSEGYYASANRSRNDASRNGQARNESRSGSNKKSGNNNNSSGSSSGNQQKLHFNGYVQQGQTNGELRYGEKKKSQAKSKSMNNNNGGGGGSGGNNNLKPSPSSSAAMLSSVGGSQGGVGNSGKTYVGHASLPANPGLSAVSLAVPKKMKGKYQQQQMSSA